MIIDEGRYSRIDIVNGIGILFVVLGHYGSFMDEESWAIWIWSWHMPLFFLTGGYLFAKKEKEYFERGLLQYLKHSVTHILFPYFVFFLLSIGVKDILLPLARGGKTISLPIFWYIKCLILGGGYLENINFPLWFFELYFICRITYYCVRTIRGFNKRLYELIILVILITTEPFQTYVSGRPPFHINVLPAGIVFMAIGSFYAEIEYRVCTYNFVRQYDELIAWLFGFLGICVAYYFPGNIANIGTLMYILGAVASVGAIYILAKHFDSNVLCFFGKNSIYILGLHGLIGGMFRNFVEGRIFKKWDGPLMNFVLVALQMMTLSFLIVVWKRGVLLLNKKVGKM